MRLFAPLVLCCSLSAKAQPLVPVELCALDSTLQEASGMLMIDDGLWVVLDSGNPNALYRLDPHSCEVTRTLSVVNAAKTDWEELAMDGQWIYIGDIGNNGGDRTDLRIYRIPLAAMLDEDVTEVLADSILFAYPDQTDFTPAYDSNNWDCESMVALDDSLFLLSKNWLTSDCYLYSLPAEPGTYVAQRRDTLASGGLITGASLHPATGGISLIGHTTADAPFAWRITGYPAAMFFQGNRVRQELVSGPLQVEGICRTSTDSVLLCSEAMGAEPARIWSMGFSVLDAIEPHARTAGLRVFPDPATDVLYLETVIDLEGVLQDVTGRVVSRWHVEEGVTSLPVGHLPEGRYTLRSALPAMSMAVVIVR